MTVSNKQPGTCPRWMGSLILTLLMLLVSMPLIAAVNPPPPASQSEEATTGYQQVLILNSYNKGYQWTDNEVQAIEDAFESIPGVILRIEYMDTKKINSEKHFELMKGLFLNKYADTRFDAIIVTDDDALKFMKRYREELFPGTPVVFAGINNFQPEKLGDFELATGVNERADFHSNIELIKRLQPDVRDVYVVVDQLTAGKLILKEFQSAASDIRHNLRFHYLTDLSMQQLRQKVATLDNKSAVFYLTFFRDASGKSFSPGEAIPLISVSASVPLYGQVDYMVGKGILGGRVKSSYYQGKIAAELASRVLSGESPETIPVIMESPNDYMFDYEQLRRFDIAIADLPPGSTIVNEPQTFYYKYKTIIWTVLGIFLVLMAFILVLLFNIKKRKRAQKGLHDIIDSMSAVFETDSLGKMREMLMQIIHRVIFLDKQVDEVRYYNYAGDAGDFDPSKLSSLDNTTSRNKDHSLQMIRQSIEKESCITHKNECVALFKSKNIAGNMIYLKGQRRFDDMDQDLLEILSNNISMAMEALEKNKLQESLETARKIQQSMLRHSFEQVSTPYGIDLHAQLIAAKEVGGDLYDCFAIDEDHLCLTVGDVAGKGMPAALFMAMAKTLIRSNAENNLQPETILFKVNNILSQDNEQCMFVTLFLGIYNRHSGKMIYANAGHNPPCLMTHDGGFSWLPSCNEMALGLFEDNDYTALSLDIQPGDSLFIYSDGVTEAMNPEAELFGEQRLEQTLDANRHLGAVELNQSVLTKLQDYSREAPQSDDITVLYLSRNEVH